MQDIKEILNKTIKEIKAIEINDNTNLLEELDSVGVLELILELENTLQQKYNRYIQIANEFSMDKEKSPFTSYKKLLKYLKDLINEN